jgi:hypothetical protein
LNKSSQKQSDQVVAFRKTARDLGCDPSEEWFNAALKKLARHKPVGPEEKPKPKKPRQ